MRKLFICFSLLLMVCVLPGCSGGEETEAKNALTLEEALDAGHVVMEFEEEKIKPTKNVKKLYAFSDKVYESTFGDKESRGKKAGPIKITVVKDGKTETNTLSYDGETITFVNNYTLSDVLPNTPAGTYTCTGGMSYKLLGRVILFRCKNQDGIDFQQIVMAVDERVHSIKSYREYQSKKKNEDQ